MQDPPATDSNSDNLHLDDLVRLPNSQLAFLDRLPGHDSDDDSDDDSEDSSDSESMTDPRGRVTRWGPLTDASTAPLPTARNSSAANNSNLISTYDDASEPAADAHDDESRVIGPPPRNQPIPLGYALVTHAFSAEQTVVQVSDIESVDRSFDPGSLVLPADRPVGSQSGLVERVQKTLVVRRVNDITRQSALVPDASTCFEVPAEALGFFSGLRSGDTVVRGPWVGAIDYFQEDVYVQFPDGSIALVPGHNNALQNIDPRTPERSKPDPFSEGIYYPGQLVKSIPEVWRSVAVWIRGEYSGIDEGVVKSVNVGEVGVEWVAKSMYSTSTDEIPMHVDERSVDVLQFSDVTPLEAFRPMWWTVGDRGFLINSTAQSSDTTDANPNSVVFASPDPEYEDSDDDGEWVEEVTSDDADLDEYTEVESLPESRSTSRSRRQGGRFIRAQRRARERTGTAEPIEALVDASLANPSSDPGDVVQVVGTKTYLDILWQDGTRDANVSSLKFRRHLHPDPYDFWPGELVHSTEDDITNEENADNEGNGSTADDSVNGNRTGGVEKRKGALIRMNHAERTAVVRWMHPETDELQEEEEVSAYELQGDEFDVGIGDTVLHVPKDNKPDKRNEWVGVVVGQRMGKCTVSWYGGKVSDVSYKELLLFMNGDEDDDSEDSGMSTDDESEEDGPQMWQADDDPTNGHAPQDSDMQHNWGTDEEDDATIVDDVIAQGGLYMAQMCSNAMAQSLTVNLSERTVRIASDVAIKALRVKLLEFQSRRERRGTDHGLLSIEEGRILGGLLFSRAFNELLSLSLSEAASSSLPTSDSGGTRVQWHTLEEMLLVQFEQMIKKADAGELAADGTDTQDEAARESPREGGIESPTMSASQSSPLNGMDGKEEVQVEMSSQIEKFDLCEELSDFHTFSNVASGSAPNVGFLSVVNREWRRLKKSLPPGIVVRVSENQNDRLRAAIIGPEDTPYADVIFFFDILMGPRYPMEPPHVWFHSYGRRLNPNLYEDGKVCLSILGTWDGDDVESWDPKNSNLLRVLLSLQALVFVEEPYFNEAGYQKQRGTEEGKVNSQTYNESAFLLSMRHALQTVRNRGAPKDCVELASAHYRHVGKRILERCKTMVEGKGSGEGTSGEFMQYCSAGFKRSLSQLVGPLEKALSGLQSSEK